MKILLIFLVFTVSHRVLSQSRLVINTTCLELVKPSNQQFRLICSQYDYHCLLDETFTKEFEACREWKWIPGGKSWNQICLFHDVPFDQIVLLDHSALNSAIHHCFQKWGICKTLFYKTPLKHLLTTHILVKQIYISFLCVCMYVVFFGLINWIFLLQLLTDTQNSLNQSSRQTMNLYDGRSVVKIWPLNLFKGWQTMKWTFTLVGRFTYGNVQYICKCRYSVKSFVFHWICLWI